jgi:hypothetical protein
MVTFLRIALRILTASGRIVSGKSGILKRLLHQADGFVGLTKFCAMKTAGLPKPKKV